MIQQKINSLRKKIRQWEYEYYVLANSSVSDEFYDQSIKELQVLEQNHPEFHDSNSPTMRVGGVISSKFFKIAHKMPMLSLDNAFEQASLQRFYDNCIKAVANINFITEPKIDGVSISLIYENNQLVQAVTRGDGQVGEGVLTNIQTIKSIPLVIEEHGLNNFEVRGEIFMTQTDFEIFNARQIQEQKLPLANPRNGAAGAIRLLNSKEVAKRPLKACFYQIVQAYEKHNILTQQEVHHQLAKMHFPTLTSSQALLANNLSELENCIHNFKKIKETWDVPCDGLVIKVNQLTKLEAIGYTSKFPKWAIAFKYPANIVTTKLEAIIATVGRTGKITYVAILSPVEINGTTVHKATLHNADYILSKDLRINDLVEVYKAGEIIPKVIGPVLPARSKETQPWVMHTTCPSCNQLLTILEPDVDQYCLNSKCLEKLYAQIKHWCSKGAMNVEGIAFSIIIKLHKLGLIQDISSLYELQQHKDTIINAKIQIKDKLFNKLMEMINLSKNNSLDRVLFGLGIEEVGKKAAQLLAKKFQSMTNLQQATAADLMNIKDIGITTANALVHWFQQPSNQKLIAKLSSLKINMQYHGLDQQVLDSIFMNQKIVITGNFFYPRNQLIEILESKYGAKIQSSVNAQTNFLLVGSEPGSKLMQAQKLNVRIIETDELKNILGI